MSKKDIQLIKKEFSFLEDLYGFDLRKEQDTNFLDVIILDYSNSKKDQIRIIKERGYYTFLIFYDNEYIDYPVILDILGIENYDYTNYSGDSGLRKLSNEVQVNLPLFLSINDK